MISGRWVEGEKGDVWRTCRRGFMNPFLVHHMSIMIIRRGWQRKKCDSVHTFMIYCSMSSCFEFEGIDMDERNFRLWMEEDKNYHTARTYTARCIRVENEMGIDLDAQYKEDEGKSLMQKLKYSRKESRAGMPPQCGIIFDIDVDVYAGMHSLRASVKKYFEFLQQKEKD